MLPELELDIERLQLLTRDRTVPSLSQVDELLGRSDEQALSLEELNLFINALHASNFAAIKSRVLERATRLRRKVHGSGVVVMAPLEVSNRCASECRFCGWRASNRHMTRLSLDPELVLKQAEYLIGKGIYHLELVSGDDLVFVRDQLPALLTAIRQRFPPGVRGTVWFCTLALTQTQYERLREAGADGMVVWQESYDKVVYDRHITRGPKAFGIDEGFRVRTNGDGYRFRLASQDRALRAGLRVAVGAMLGLNPDLNLEMLATVAHARHLLTYEQVTPAAPLVIGMPIWNHITTPQTDSRPATAMSVEPFFSYLSALYFLALDPRRAWIFPNCRVSLPTQVEAVASSGVFTSTEVKVGPGGYLASAMKAMSAEEQAEVHGLLRRSLHAHYRPDMDIARFFDGVEQFLHHHHPHEHYLEEFRKHDLELIPC